MRAQYGHELLHALTATQVVATLGIVAILSFLTKLFKRRRTFTRLQRKGLPMPPHNFLFGHLLLVAKIARTWPRGFHGHYLALEIKRRFPMLPSIFYLDLWPTGPQLVVITSAAGASRIAQHEPQLLKHEVVSTFLQPLIGKHGLVILEGDEWKYWRRIFNPGFNTTYLWTQVSGIIENTRILCEILDERSGGEVFSLFETMSRLTMDMSCLTTLGSRLNAQREGCDLVAALRSQASWIPSPNEGNLFRKLNPLRYVIYCYNRWRMDRYVSRELESHFTIRTQGQGIDMDHVKKSKAVVDLALEAYLSERQASVSRSIEGKPTSPQRPRDTSKTAPMTMDAKFKQFATSQMKLFLFAGYETAAGTAVYAIHLLSLHSQSLQRARDEHDAVLGTGLTRAETAALISHQPQLLSRLVYTSAVIKEALRLYPPVSATRQSAAGFTLLDETQGQVFETEGFMLWGVHQAIHRSPDYWPSPDRFVPERWLVDAGHALYPRNREAWRPFEKGPRNCIGQELALLEVRVILAMVLRDFDFKDAYAEYNLQTGRAGPTEVMGDRAYQVLRGSSKPNHGYPCKVTKRVDGEG